MVLPSVGTEAEIIILLILLVTAFVAAFKIMQMIFETILVSVLSMIFYASLAVLLNFHLSIERILLFAFLGATLYMGYSFLASSYTIVETIIKIPYHIIKTILKIPCKIGFKTYSYLKKKYRLHQMKKGTEDYSPENNSTEKEKGKDVKDVVLDKVGKSKDEEK